MKYLISILLLCLSGYVIAGKCPDGSQSPQCTYPGYVPTWDTRYSVTCSMTDTDSGTMRASFTEGGIDYPQAGSLMVKLNGAVISWYENIVEGATGNNVDTRLLPDLTPFTTELIRIEKAMSER